MSPQEFREGHFTIEARLNLIYELLHAMHDKTGEEIVSATEASRRLGVPRSRMNNAWNLPDYGKFGTKIAWRLWREWWEIPEVTRRARWDGMTLAERRECMGMAS